MHEQPRGHIEFLLQCELKRELAWALAVFRKTSCIKSLPRKRSIRNTTIKNTYRSCKDVGARGSQMKPMPAVQGPAECSTGAAPSFQSWKWEFSSFEAEQPMPLRHRRHQVCDCYATELQICRWEQLDKKLPVYSYCRISGAACCLDMQSVLQWAARFWP